MKKITILITLFFAQILQAQIYVDLSATGNNNGSSWVNAYTSIQAAVNSASDNDTILIAQGTYHKGSHISIFKPLILKGGYPTGGGAQDISNNPTIVDGGDFDRVFRAIINTGVLYLEGLTIQNGRLCDTYCAPNGDYFFGAGIYISGDLDLNQVTVVNNNATSYDAREVWGPPYYSRGGGIYVTNGNITLTDSLVINNIAATVSRRNSAAFSYGAGICSENGTITLTNSKVIGNIATATSESDADSFGGGIYGTNITLTNSMVSSNVASSSSGVPGNFSADSASSSGGGIYGTDITLTNSLVNNNVVSSTTDNQDEAYSFGAGIDGSTTLVNSILWGNRRYQESEGWVDFDDFYVPLFGLTTSHSVINGADLTGSNGLDATAANFDTENFIDAENGNFGLMKDSLLINAGDDAVNATIHDLLDNQRRVGVIDIGPYEAVDFSSKNFTSSASTYYFNPASKAIMQDGLSWATAFDKLNDYFQISDTSNISHLYLASGDYKTTGTLDFSSEVQLNGGYDAVANVPKFADISTIDVQHNNRVIYTTQNITLNQIKLINGFHKTFDPPAMGGGLLSLGNINLNNSQVVNNFALSFYFKAEELRPPHDLYYSLSFGGGIYGTNNTLTNSIVSNNLASSYYSHYDDDGSSDSEGGGIYGSNNTLTNSLVAKNIVLSYFVSGEYDADSSTRGGGVRGSSVLKNSILWGNKKYEEENNIISTNVFNEFDSSPFTTSHSMVRGFDLSASNGIDATVSGFNPLFVDVPGGDFRLQTGSPLINEGLDSYNTTTQDLDGNLRKFGTIDIGPYEHQTPRVGMALNVSVSMFQVTFDYYLENLSSIDLQNLALAHDLDTLFGAGNYSINSALIVVDDPSTLNLNTGFNGASNTAIIDANSTLAGLDTAQIRLVVDVNTIINSGNYSTQVTINAQDADMNLISDSSDFSTETDANSNNNANETGENDATTFSIMTIPATFSMSYTPDAIVVNNSSTVQFTIDNSAGTTASNLAFSQTLPTGLVVADTANMINNCGGSFTANGTSISLSGGMVNVASTCSINVDIVATQGGTFNTSTGDLTSDVGNSGTANDTLTVDGAPIVIAPNNITTEATANLTAVNIGTATATDEDGVLTPIADNLGPYQVGVTQVTWSVADSNGTIGSAVQTITITDTTAPIITLIGNSTINLTVGDVYTDAGATASDLVDGDLTSSLVTTGTVDTGTANTYMIQYNVQDFAGNDALEVTRTVIVSEPETYFVGGTVEGLIDGNTFVLKLNNAEEKIISQNGEYIFNTPLIEDDTYSVSIDLDPNNPVI